MHRKKFLQSAASLALFSPLFPAVSKAASWLPSRQETALNPRWYGFNLTEMFSGFNPQPFRESDFEMMAEWGFNFARIPLSYWNWSKPDVNRWMNIDEDVFKLVDQLVGFGKKHGIHVCLNLHRIPGYCINDRDKEPVDLFDDTDEHRGQALKAAVHHWRFIARRYKDVPPAQLSFDLINEPPDIPHDQYAKVVNALTGAILESNPARQVVADGLQVGRSPVPELPPTLLQSIHCYDPMYVTHYKASWVKLREVKPAWPLHLDDGSVWNREKLMDYYRPWIGLNKQGFGVHVGEWGVYNHTPHAVALAYMQDQLSIWKSLGWGWSLWNLRGGFGLLDSGREDVAYENYKGHKLDRKMLELLKQYAGS